MLKRLPASMWLILAAVLFFLLSSIFFVVNEKEKAIKLRLGSVVRAEYGPGLHFKLPIIENVRKFDSRILTLDLPPERVLTSENKNVIVDSFVKWRIVDTEEYLVSLRGDERLVNFRLTEFIRNGVKDAFGNRTVQQVVSSQRTELMNEIRESVNSETSNLGIHVEDVRIKKVELPEDVRESVYQRMEKERAAIAREIRSEGEELAKKIRAEADRVRAETIAKAYSESEQNRGRGDAESARVYAEAYTKDPEFYRLYRSLNAYREAFNGPGDVLILQPDSEFFNYFNDPAARLK